MTLHSINNKKGDSIIEVLIAVAIFSTIAVASLSIMNRGLQNAQSALETTIARTELDTQAEMIRFLADSASSQDGSSYKNTWDEIISGTSNNLLAAPVNSDCAAEAYKNTPYCSFLNDYQEKSLENCSGIKIGDYKAFVLKDNDGNITRQVPDPLTDSLPGADTGGLFVVVVEGPKTVVNGQSSAEYYDFYVNTCWNKPGEKTASKLSTTVRVKNPSLSSATVQDPGSTDGENLQVKIVWSQSTDYKEGTDPTKNNFPTPPGDEWLRNGKDVKGKANTDGSERYNIYYTDAHSTADHNAGEPLGESIHNGLVNSLDPYLTSDDNDAKRQGNYVFDGLYYDSARTQKVESGHKISFKCNSVPGASPDQRQNCKWNSQQDLDNDGTNETNAVVDEITIPADSSEITYFTSGTLTGDPDISQLTLYAKWRYDPKYLYCLYYNIDTHTDNATGFSEATDEDWLSGRTTSGAFIADNKFCKEFNNNTSSQNLALDTTSGKFAKKSTDTEVTGRNGWRINNNPVNSTNYDNDKINGANVSIATTNTDNTVSGGRYSRYKAVYYYNVYPHWEKADPPEDPEEDPEEDSVEVLFGEATEVVTPKDNGDESTNCRNGGTACGMYVTLYYPKPKKKNSKILALYAYSEGKFLVYPNNYSYGSGKENYIKLEDCALNWDPRSPRHLKYDILNGDGCYNQGARLSNFKRPHNNEIGSAMYLGLAKTIESPVYFSVFGSLSGDEYIVVEPEKGATFKIKQKATGNCWHAFAYSAKLGRIIILDRTSTVSDNLNEKCPKNPPSLSEGEAHKNSKTEY